MFGAGGVAPFFRDSDFNELPSVVPVIDRVGNIKAFVALQSDDLCAGGGGQYLRHFSFSDASFTFEQEWAVEFQGEVNRCDQPCIGNVIVVSELLL